MTAWSGLVALAAYAALGYLLTGARKVLADFAQPPRNRPAYCRHSPFAGALIAVFAWPAAWWRLRSIFRSQGRQPPASFRREFPVTSSYAIAGAAVLAYLFLSK